MGSSFFAITDAASSASSSTGGRRSDMYLFVSLSVAIRGMDEGRHKDNREQVTGVGGAACSNSTSWLAFTETGERRISFA